MDTNVEIPKACPNWNIRWGVGRDQFCRINEFEGGALKNMAERISQARPDEHVTIYGFMVPRMIFLGGQLVSNYKFDRWFDVKNDYDLGHQDIFDNMLMD